MQINFEIKYRKRIEWKEVVVHVINDVVRWCRILIDQDSINTGKGALYRAAMWDYVTNSLYLILQYYYHIYPDFGNYFLELFLFNLLKNLF